MAHKIKSAIFSLVFLTASLSESASRTFQMVKSDLLFIFLLLVSFSAWSYPELSRHGYVNCTACHASPSGGGILNQYGRELSKELLSTWSKEGEQKPLYGVVNDSEKFYLAAFVRGLQLHRETATVREGRPILMQADIESAVVFGNLTVDGTVGRQEYRTSEAEGVRPFSRRHFLNYNYQDSHNFRFGRFQKFYGLNDPNHTLYVRRDLDFGQDSETYNLEYSYLGESFSIYAAKIFGNFQDRYSNNQEEGYSLSASYFWADKQKIGLSLYDGSDETQERLIGGLWGILSFSDNIFILSEFDYQTRKSKPSNAEQFGYVTTHKIVCEVHKGVLPYILFEHADLDKKNELNRKTGWAVGLQFLPRPHFELVAQWEKETLDKVENSNTDVGWLMLNVYL